MVGIDIEVGVLSGLRKVETRKTSGTDLYE